MYGFVEKMWSETDSRGNVLWTAKVLMMKDIK